MPNATDEIAPAFQQHGGWSNDGNLCEQKHHREVLLGRRPWLDCCRSKNRKPTQTVGGYGNGLGGGYGGADELGTVDSADRGFEGPINLS